MLDFACAVCRSVKVAEALSGAGRNQVVTATARAIAAIASAMYMGRRDHFPQGWTGGDPEAGLDFRLSGMRTRHSVIISLGAYSSLRKRDMLTICCASSGERSPARFRGPSHNINPAQRQKQVLNLAKSATPAPYETGL